jgi:polyhydroxyalkanoate synthesis regulator phasin
VTDEEAFDLAQYAAGLFVKTLAENGGISKAKAQAVLDHLVQQAADGDEATRAKLQELLVGMALDEARARRVYAALGFEV